MEHSQIFDSPEFARLMVYYDCAMMEIRTKFDVLNADFSLKYDRQPLNSVKTRLKSPDSILEKLHRYDYPVTLESIEKNIEDVAGVRVICSFLDDLYFLADTIQKQDDVEVLYIKDYIANPKPSGYRSLHMFVSIPIFLANEKRTMRVEIQFRTIAMDFWASLEHQLRYKKEDVFTPEMTQDIVRCAELSAELDHTMDRLRAQVAEAEQTRYF